MKRKEQIQEGLAQFIGTAHYYDTLYDFDYTDGIQYLAQNAECYWLIDFLGIRYVKHESMYREEFIVWLLEKHEDNSATLTAWTDTPKKSKKLFEAKIEFTDFPLDSITLYLTGGVLMLPREY